MFAAEPSWFEETAGRLGSREGGSQRTYVKLGIAEVMQYGAGGSPCGKQQ